MLATVGAYERWDVKDAKKYASIEVEEALTSVQVSKIWFPSADFSGVSVTLFVSTG